MKDLIKKVYYNSPASLIKTAKMKISLLPFHRNTEAHPRVPAILDANYFIRRNQLVQKMFTQIYRGASLDDVIQGFPAKEYGERVVEYLYFVSWLLRQKAGAELLDIGCVLNNEVVSNILHERIHAVWFLNPSIEPHIFLNNPIYYHVTELEKNSFSPERFSLITSFSTIEHIGFDNSQYGNNQPQIYFSPTPEPLINSFKTIARLLSPQGKMLISVPFGFQEVITHPVTGKLSSQIFNASSIEEGIKSLRQEDVTAEAEVFHITENGWQRSNLQSCNNMKYADGCPGASAVIFINGQKI